MKLADWWAKLQITHLQAAVWVTVLALAVAMAVALASNWPTDSAIWASWFQAIGTIAALVGVLWIAHADERRRQDDQLSSAVITAVGVQRDLPRLLGVVVSASNNLGSGGSIDSLLEKLSKTSRVMDGMTLPTEDQMLRLVPIGKHFSLTFAHGVGLVAQARSLLSVVAASASANDPENARRGADSVIDSLNKARASLEFAQKALQEFNVKHAAIHWPRKAPPD